MLCSLSAAHTTHNNEYACADRGLVSNNAVPLQIRDLSALLEFAVRPRCRRQGASMFGTTGSVPAFGQLCVDADGAAEAPGAGKGQQ